MRSERQIDPPLIGNMNVPRALELVGEIVMLPDFIKKFPSRRLIVNDGGEAKRTMSALEHVAGAIGNAEMAADFGRTARSVDRVKRQMNELSPAKWAAGMKSAFRVAAFVQLLDRSLSLGIASLTTTDPETALMYGENRKPPSSDLRQIAYLSAHERLLRNTHDARWLSLVLFSIGRAIAVNSNNAFGANEWTDVTFMWFELERSFLFSDGKTFARQIVDMDKSIFQGEMPKILGERLPHGLAEMAVNAHQTRYFTEV